jgi:vacuolar protein sorting-associated protein 26
MLFYPVVILEVVCDVFPFARYLLRVTVVKWLSDVVKDMPLVVRTLTLSPETNSSIKMEVGIEDCLHIEFEYNKCR